MTNNPLRNLQMISSPGVGGREIDVPVLSRKLIEQGHPTWVMCRPGTLVEQLSREWSIPIVHTKMNWYFNPVEIIKLMFFLKKEKIQVIHAHWSKDLSNLIIAAGLAGGIPVVLTKHVYATELKRDIFHDWIYRHTDMVIAISDLVADNIYKTVKIKREKIITIYNGIELNERWNPALTVIKDLHQAFGVEQGKHILGYVGRLNEGKQPHFILEAFKHLSDQYKDWHFVLVGKAVGEQEERYAAKLKDTVKLAGLEKRVHFSGYRNDVPSVMHSFDILACASRFESLGMVMVEAMAMERPAIGPDSGGVPEIIEPGVNGHIYKSDDLDDLCQKLKDIMGNQMSSQKMGKKGREIVLKKFNLDLMARQVCDVFRQAIK